MVIVHALRQSTTYQRHRQLPRQVESVASCTMGLTEVFNEAAERVKQLTESPSNEDKLELYANFKQANVGDNDTCM